MKNKLLDLNNHLFAEIERLSDEDLSDEELEKEIERAKAITGISNQIGQIAKLQFDAIKLQCEYQGYNNDNLANLIGVTNEKMS